MKRTPLKRTAMKRQATRLPWRSKKRAAEADERARVREAVFVRDEFRCQLQGHTNRACFGGLTPHHVLKASQGGDYSIENLMTLCASHNDAIEEDADIARLAYGLGFVRFSWERP